MSWFYALVTMVLVLFGVIVGFRKGFRRQIPSIIGLAFGVICARLFIVPGAQIIAEVYPACCGMEEECYVYYNLAAGIVFLAVYFVFRLATGILGRALKKREKGVFDSIAGCFLCVFIYLTILSISFNFIICLHPDTELTKLSVDGDGNIAGEVSLLAPFLFDTPSPEDLSHLLQLRDARTIS